MRRLIFALLLVPGCADRSLGTGDGTGSSDGSGTSDGTPTGTTTSPTDPTDPTVPGTVSATLTDPTSPMTSSTTVPPDPTSATSTSTSTTDVTASATETGSCQDPPGLPNDSPCADASGCGCASGKCFLVPLLGGFCGECLGDADCSPGGCTIPDPINGIGSRCNKGEPGAGCESDAVCSDPGHPHCAPVLAIEGVIKVATCGACAGNADCPPDADNCTPVYDIQNFGGVFECLPDASVPDGAGCNLSDDGQGEPIGDAACKSGFCGEANVMGLLKVGVCGACNSDGDCLGNTKCTEPMVDLDAGVLVPAMCV